MKIVMFVATLLIGLNCYASQTWVPGTKPDHNSATCVIDILDDGGFVSRHEVSIKNKSWSEVNVNSGKFGLISLFKDGNQLDIEANYSDKTGLSITGNRNYNGVFSRVNLVKNERESTFDDGPNKVMIYQSLRTNEIEFFCTL